MTVAAWCFMLIIWIMILSCAGIVLNKIVNNK